MASLPTRVRRRLRHLRHRLPFRRRPSSRYRRGLFTDRPVLGAAVGIVGVVVVVLAIAGAIAAWRLTTVASDLRSARNLLNQVQLEVSDGQLAIAQTHLDQAQSIIGRANSRVNGDIEFDLISWLPVVHQNITALRSSVGLAYSMVSGGSDILHSAKPLQGPTGKLEVPLRKGGIPLTTVVQAQQSTAQLASVLPAPDDKPNHSLLVGPIKELQQTVHDEAAKRRVQLETLARGMALLDDMAGANGPRRYLIAVANTAEERGAGGMILSYGELDSANGQFTLGSFANVDKLKPITTPVGTTLPDDYRNRWNGYQYATNFRQATLGADFPMGAPVLAQMYTASTGLAVDGVIQIDPSGLAAILEGTGPVDVPNLGTVSAQNVVDYSINKAYFQYPDRDQRQSVLGDIARAAFDRLLNGDYPSLRGLATSMSDAVAGRHLLMWASDPTVATQLRFFDADGSLPLKDSNYLSLTVQNMSGNKLDYYMDTSMDVRSIAAPPGDSRRFEDIAIMLNNRAPPDGTLQYVFGPFDAAQKRGRYHGVVSLYLPTGTQLRGSDGPFGTAPNVTTEGGREVIGFEVNTDAGQANVFVLHLALLPDGGIPQPLMLVPQARVRPTTVTTEIAASRGPALNANVSLTQSWLLRPGAAPLPASGPQLAQSKVR